MTTKETNPKDSVGIRKVPYSTIPYPPVISAAGYLVEDKYDFPYHVLPEIGIAMLEGARKYGRHNYRVSSVKASVYFDAFMRHMMLGWLAGEDLDEDSGLSHVTKSIATLVVVYDAVLNDNWIDDRPPVHAMPPSASGQAGFKFMSLKQVAFSAIFNMIYWWENGDTENLRIALASLFVLRDRMDIEHVEREQMYKTWRPSLQEKVDLIFEKYPVAKEAYTNALSN